MIYTDIHADGKKQQGTTAQASVGIKAVTLPLTAHTFWMYDILNIILTQVQNEFSKPVMS